MALTFSGSVVVPSLLTIKPRKVTLYKKKLDFFLLKLSYLHRLWFLKPNPRDYPRYMSILIF